eukprot:2716091-Pleurochrysis_carterae.AAC.1
MVGSVPWWRRLRLRSLCTDLTCPPGSWCGVSPPPSSSPTEASTTGARRMGLATSPITGLVTVALASKVPGGSRTGGVALRPPPSAAVAVNVTVGVVSDAGRAATVSLWDGSPARLDLAVLCSADVGASAALAPR